MCWYCESLSWNELALLCQLEIDAMQRVLHEIINGGREPEWN